MKTQYVTDSAEALAAAEVPFAEVWIHGSVTYVTVPDTEPVQKEIQTKQPKVKK